MIARPRDLTLGRAIAHRRRDLRMSQAEFGRRLGQSEATVNRTEWGKRGVSPHELAATAEILGTTAAELLGLGEPDTLPVRSTTEIVLLVRDREHRRAVATTADAWRFVARAFVHAAKVA